MQKIRLICEADDCLTLLGECGWLSLEEIAGAGEIIAALWAWVWVAGPSSQSHCAASLDTIGSLGYMLMHTKIT